MANNVYLVCWESHDYFGIGVQIQNLAGDVYSASETLIQLDTGYSGELLIPELIFESLQLDTWELPISLPTYGSTITGESFSFRQAPVKIIIPKINKEYYATAQTFNGCTRLLIGRAFLRHFKVILDWQGKQTCLMVPKT
ncbi:MAG: hypothetical protein B6242_10015 [Anaerolineaceae bacterium 4572_78]|nr:MAG: hypothetical protein B6242_10015 [Anaerolineaceae bacterium 4572_78]